MWQRSLALLSDKLEHDQLAEMLNVRVDRTIVITDRHLVYCRATHVQEGHTQYKMRWLLPLQDINNISGARPALFSFAAYQCMYVDV